MLVDSVINVIKRFPLLILIALVGTIAFSLNIHLEPKDTLLVRIGLICSIGVFMSGALYLFAERKNFSVLKKQLFVALTTLPILIIYFYNFIPETEDSIRLVFLILTTTLIITLSYPYGSSTQTDFWYFNKVLFLRVLVSGLFTFTLYLGLSLALKSIDKLFGVDISDKAYTQLFAWLLGIFSIFVFLAGVPADLDSFSGKRDYPKSLKIFTQYILIPIAFTYMLILYIYAITILINWELPRGMVTGITLAYSAIGILSVLFVFPLIESGSNRWIKLFQAWFYRLLFPLLFLMGFAIYQRVSDYGITIDRYLSIVATLWLFCMALYFTFSSKKNIKIIPISLVFVGLLISFGPQSAFTVSENSQMKRLDKLISQYHLLDKENLKKVVIVKETDYHNISSISDYLLEFHNTDRVYEILNRKSNISIDSIKKMSSWETGKLFNIDFKNDYFSCYYDELIKINYKPFEISGYDNFFEYHYDDDTTYARGEMFADEFYTKIDVKKQILNFVLKIGSIDTLQLDLSKIVSIAKQKDKFDFGDMQNYTAENNTLKVKFIPTACDGNSKGIKYLAGYILYSVKKPK